MLLGHDDCQTRDVVNLHVTVNPNGIVRPGFIDPFNSTESERLIDKMYEVLVDNTEHVILLLVYGDELCRCC